ncbi:MAG: DUF3748 domain-containing protein [Agriterribacter sp.]
MNRYLLLPVLYSACLMISCSSQKQSRSMQFTETQLTTGDYGHFLNSTQVFSPDDEWIVYDTRNDDGGIATTGAIEMVNTNNGAIKPLYNTTQQTKYGPGVGAATFNPLKNLVLFIHGIRNANEKNPYGFTRRTAVGINLAQPFKPIFMDARDIEAPFTPGALRGGTHAYTWSGDGEWLCFTYNDYIIDQLSKHNSSVKDMRTIAVMCPGNVTVKDSGNLENNSGEKFSAVVATVTERPAPGSDDIDKAFDEGWIGKKGYSKKDGSWQHRAIAFQGNVRNEKNETIAEIFVADLPEDITKPFPGKPLEGTATTRPNVPEGVSQRRITYTQKGVLGPRHWLKSTSDGALILFMSKDEKGIVQVFGVSPNGGTIQQITFNDFSIEGPINISPDDKYLSYIADRSVFITDIKTGKSERLTPAATDLNKPEGAVIWSYSGKVLAYNRRIKKDTGSFIQIFLLKR